MGVRCGHGCCRSFSIAVCLQARFPFAQFSYTDGGKQYDITPEKMVVRVFDQQSLGLPAAITVDSKWRNSTAGAAAGTKGHCVGWGATGAKVEWIQQKRQAVPMVMPTDLVWMPD